MTHDCPSARSSAEEPSTSVLSPVVVNQARLASAFHSVIVLTRSMVSFFFPLFFFQTSVQAPLNNALTNLPGLKRS